jgi:hypothetical protein
MQSLRHITSFRGKIEYEQKSTQIWWNDVSERIQLLYALSAVADTGRNSLAPDSQSGSQKVNNK